MKNVRLLAVYAEIEQVVKPEDAHKLAKPFQPIFLGRGKVVSVKANPTYGLLAEYEDGSRSWNADSNDKVYIPDKNFPLHNIFPFGKTIVGHQGGEFHILEKGRWKHFYSHPRPVTLVKEHANGNLIIGDCKGIYVLSQKIILGKAKIKQVFKVTIATDADTAGNWQSRGDPEGTIDGTITHCTCRTAYINQKVAWQAYGEQIPAGWHMLPFAVGVITVETIAPLNPLENYTITYRNALKGQREVIREDFNPLRGDRCQTAEKSHLFLLTGGKLLIGRRIEEKGVYKTNLVEYKSLSLIVRNCVEMLRHPWGVLFHLKSPTGEDEYIVIPVPMH